MTTTEHEDKLASAKAQGQAQFDSIKEMVAELELRRSGAGTESEDEREADIECAEREIHEDALSVEVRSDWVPAGARWDKDGKPCEYRILLCTGGPAVQIVGELNEHGEPETARLQVQDWFTPWTDFRPASPEREWMQILLEYARCFYFGEG